MRSRVMASLAVIAVVLGLGFAVNRPLTTTVAAPTGPEITVYNSNLALIREQRTMPLQQGLNVVRIDGVPARIDPTSVYFRSLTDPEGTVVLEQNFEYDLVNTQKVLQKYLGEEVRITATDGSVYVGRLLSAGGDVMLAREGEDLVILRYDQIQKFELSALPSGLVLTPTLAWLIQAGQEGEHQVEMAYLTEGMNWQAYYTFRLAPDAESLDINGWVTVENRSGATYENAKLKLVAGAISRVAPAQVLVRMEKAVEAPAPSPEVEERAFFEYYLYEIQRPVTLLNNQTKQVEFITATAVPARKRYILDLVRSPYRGEIIGDPEVASRVRGNPDVYIEFQTGPQSGLEAPLPAGVVRLYQEDVDGAPLLIGETTIDHTPVGERVKLQVGKAFDVVGERTQTDFVKLGPRALEETYEVVIRNRKATPVTVQVVERLFRSGDWEIAEASHPYTKADAQTVHFTVEVPAEDEVTITYTVRYRW